MNRLTTLLILGASLLTSISFASEYQTIDGKYFLVINRYYIEEVTPAGSLIMEGWIHAPNIQDNLVQEYFVYGLTNVYIGINYTNALYSNATNDYFYGYNKKCPALVMIPDTEIKNLSDEAGEIAKNNSAQQLAYVQTLQKANMTAVAERDFITISVRATNGSPANQYALGQMYLQGEYPCPTNDALGFFWIKKAAANNDTQAKTYLQSLSPVPATGN